MKAMWLAGSALAVLAMPMMSPAEAQTTPKESQRASTVASRPDLEGFWDNRSITDLERPRGVAKLVVSEAEAAALVRRNPLIILTEQERKSVGEDPNNTDLLKDKNADRGYNTFWIDPGTRLADVKGELRTSWIVEPSDGRIPYKTGVTTGGTGLSPVNFDGPETRPLAERCLYMYTAGPVMRNVMYNNTMQVVQAPDAVIILLEMIHQVRIIPIGGKHGPSDIPKWGGDSIGWYEGDTLVVETVNAHPQQRSLISPEGKLTERFRRWSDTQILYEFTVDDPTRYTQVWRGEMAINRSAQPPYEFACHEGNYAMAGILGGARELESKGITPALGPGIAAGLDVIE
ncbi:MAG: hypothetical protein Q8R02_02340 [Hyphomonadaceae bacterium]|nr:hypothetical protein [Hyphomonadaceae bacterium]